MYFIFCAIRLSRLVYETLYSIAALYQMEDLKDPHSLVYAFSSSLT